MQSNPATAEASSAGTILIVDDEPLLLRAVSRVLRRCGYAVEQATDGRTALEHLQRGHYDALFIDIAMPGPSGIEVLQEAHSSDPDLPVVLMSGSPTLQSAIDAVSYGALRYLLKPVDIPTLEATAAEAVRRRRKSDQERRRPEALLDESALHSQLDRGLSAMWLAYQPIVSWPERRVFAWEALVRTREPSLPNPGVFIELAQRVSQLQRLGRHIRATVAEACRSHDRRVFVNLHPEDLVDENLYDPGAPLSQVAHRVVLEITERAGLDHIRDLEARRAQLRILGYGLAVDDLGEGYAGLTSLVRLEPDYVKLDMSLIRDLDGSPRKRHIVRSALQLCRELRCTVIGEGVETEAERDALAALGCDLLQGYFFARPSGDWSEPKFEPAPSAPAVTNEPSPAAGEALEVTDDTVDEGVVVADANGAVEFANTAAARILGTARVQAGSRALLVAEGFFNADGASGFDDERLPLRRALAGEDTRDVPMLLRDARHPEGLLLYVSASPWRQGTGAVLRLSHARTHQEER
jgi:EAL domain-containing protein (putative c-di-GMP-specific phosphodiesterase class I)